MADVVWHLKRNGSWRYKLAEIYYTPELDAALGELVEAERIKAA